MEYLPLRFTHLISQIISGHWVWSSLKIKVSLKITLNNNKGQRKADLNSHFLVANVLEPDFPVKMKQLYPKNFDIIYLGSVLHLFSEEQTKTAIQNCSQVLQEDGILFGRCVGMPTPGIVTSSDAKDLRYLHSPETLKVKNNYNK
jgi:SAM-dependent methyltransferase